MLQASQGRSGRRTTRALAAAIGAAGLVATLTFGAAPAFADPGGGGHGGGGGGAGSALTRLRCGSSGRSG